MITMRDVAERAGVSVTTVSHVINESRPVSDELRERVLAAMKCRGWNGRFYLWKHFRLGAGDAVLGAVALAGMAALSLGEWL